MKLTLIKNNQQDSLCGVSTSNLSEFVSEIALFFLNFPGHLLVIQDCKAQHGH